MAEMTEQERALINAAIDYVEAELLLRDEQSREGWALVDAYNNIPNGRVFPLYG